MAEQPEVVFFRRPNPREGETTITQVSGDLYRFFQAQLQLFRELTSSGTVLPLVVTRDAGGVVDSETLTLEGLRNGQTTAAVVNHFSMQLRAGINAGHFESGTIIVHAVLQPDSAAPTVDLTASNGVVAWLADRERTVQVRLPIDGEVTGERVIGLPIYSAAHPVAVWPVPKPQLGAVTACGFEPDESGTWTMFESGALVQRDRNGELLLEAPRPQIEGELDRVRIQADGAVVISVRGTEHTLFTAPTPLYGAAVTQNVQFALTAHDRQTVLWDLYVGHASQVIPVDGHHTAVAFSNDGRLGLFGGPDGSLTLVQLLPD